ncbi:four helix bundle protein [bacterium]|nr:four helix bundle protein [bacterium]MBU1599939.1 four helix bundle protein [bacterium]
MAKEFDFENLEVYQMAIDFVNMIYEITKRYPKSELFTTVSQFRRASLSIPLNIAEGAGRLHKKERIQFYQIAKTSVSECIPIMEISKKQGFLKEDEYQKLYQIGLKLSKMLVGLIKSV